MSELNLYLVRHGETESNVDKKVHLEKADHAIRLTDKGKQQADEAGTFLLDYLEQERARDPENFGNVRVWYSPYYRARETAGFILGQLGKKFGWEEKADGSLQELTHSEDAFLFERKSGLNDGMEDEEFAAKYPDEWKDQQKHRQFNGNVYARSPLGDSQIDVAIRAKPFFGTILRDKETKNIRHVIVVNHGLTLRAMTMAWMRYPPEWMDAERNPKNCWIRHIHGKQGAGYVDEGYIFGNDAPIRDVMAKQIQLENPEQIFMLKPQRPGTIVPKGVIPFDPFAKLRSGPE